MTTPQVPRKIHRVLCVDDDTNKLEELKDIFEEWMENNPYGTFEVITESSFDDACGRLASQRFDLMTLDLSDNPAQDPTSMKGQEQAGEMVYQKIQAIRFLPVIFYSGFAGKIPHLASPAVKIVKKGSSDVSAIREAAREIFETGLPKLISHIDEEVRRYMWDTIAAEWARVAVSVSEKDLAYLMARRLASGLSSESVKSFLNRPPEKADGIEHYIYPPLEGKVRTGEIIEKDGSLWVVVTPACDFPNPSRPLANVLLVGTRPLAEMDEFRKWASAWSGNPPTHSPSRGEKADLEKLLKNNYADRYRFLPGTFFMVDSVADFQLVRRLEIGEFSACKPLCRLDNPYRQEFILAFSRYIGRLGTPDLDMQAAMDRLVPKVQPAPLHPAVPPPMQIPPT